MLILGRTSNQSIHFEIPPSTEPRRIVVGVGRLSKSQVKLALDADRDVQIVRGELVETK